MRIIFVLLLVLASTLTANSYAEERPPHDHMSMSQGHSAPTPLTEPGNGAFAAIQEAIKMLMADPNTDWSRVDLEALRLHLVDMNNFTLYVKVISKKPIPNGVEFTVAPTTKDAEGSLERLFAAHPAILKQESGWDMKVTKNKRSFTARVTSQNQNDIKKIRGLGYIGIIALGQHHQLHHWLMSVGLGPHEHRP